MMEPCDEDECQRPNLIGRIRELEAELARIREAFRPESLLALDLAEARAEKAEARVAELEEWKRLHPFLGDELRRWVRILDGTEPAPAIERGEREAD